MKVIRYNGSYRYKAQRRKRILTMIPAAIAALAVLTAVVFGVIWLIHRPPTVSVDNQEPQTEYIPFLNNGETAELELSAGTASMLTLPLDADIRKVVFTSDNEKVAKVDPAGRLDAVAAGSAVITAEGDDFIAECSVTVTEAAQPEELTELTTAIKANEDIVEKNAENGVNDLYNITVNRRTNTVTVYTYDDKGEYTVPVRAMVASCGTGGRDITPVGEYATYFRESWHLLYGDVIGMYVTGIEGPYLFHSIPCEIKSHDSIKIEEFNKLGTNASQGCVRLMVSDARWIYKNCALNTPVKVIDEDESADPLGKPPTIKISSDIRWDPTDPDKRNPYKGKLPEIIGPSDAALNVGDEFDPMEGVKAVDICGNDITGDVTLTGSVVTEKPGVYLLTYSLTDVFHQHVEVTVTVTVKEADR